MNVTAIFQACQSDYILAAIIDRTANMQRSRKCIPVDYMTKQLKKMLRSVNEKKVRDAFQQLEAAGAGKLFIGRRGKDTRFVWNGSSLPTANDVIKAGNGVWPPLGLTAKLNQKALVGGSSSPGPSSALGTPITLRRTCALGQPCTPSTPCVVGKPCASAQAATASQFLPATKRAAKKAKQAVPNLATPNVLAPPNAAGTAEAATQDEQPLLDLTGPMPPTGLHFAIYAGFGEPTMVTLDG